MGDLVIKPEAGGSIKLQNNAGTNALVSDNSGNVTLAGSTTISGGTISSAVTFPTGHIVGFSTIAHTYTQTSITSQTLADWSGMSVVITPSDATNKIIICGNLNCYGNASNSLNCVLFRDDGGGFDVLGGLVDYFHNESSESGSMTLSWIDTPGVTVATTYKIQIRSDGGGQCYLNVNDASSSITGEEASNSWMYAMEVVA